MVRIRCKHNQQNVTRKITGNKRSLSGINGHFLSLKIECLYIKALTNNREINFLVSQNELI